MRTNCVKLDSLGPSFELIARCQIAATDAQIDRLVYDLYGLTEEEVKIVQ